MENDDNFAGFGVPKSSGGPTDFPWRRHSLKAPDPNKGETQTRFVGRIIPPFKSLAGSYRGWAFYHDLYFGYDGLSKRNPNKTRMRPFVVKGTERKTNPAELKILQVKEQLETLQKDLSARQAPEAEIRTKTQPLVDWLRYHNRDSKWYLNVVGEDGELYVLQITNKCKKDLELEMRKLEDQGMSVADIMNPKGGVWFEFIRTGSKHKVGEIQDKVSVVMETQQIVDGQGRIHTVQVRKSAALTQPQIERVLQNAPDLALEVVQFLTVEQAHQLVNGPADPAFVDSVWGDAPVKPPAPTDSDSQAKADEFFSRNFGS